MNLDEELRALGQELLGAGWQTKPEAEWTPEEHTAYHRWAQEEVARQEAEARADGRTVRVVATLATDRDEYDRKTSVGAFLRPTRVTLNITNDTLTQYFEDGGSTSKQYPGVNVEEV